ncbi:PIN domain-containing protein [Candidatus Nitrospira salsa]
MICVFLDANVLFSASNIGGNIFRLVHLLIEREEAVTSDFAAEEARRNVQLKRQPWAENLNALLRQVRVVPSIQFDLPVKLSDKDQPILCTAIRCGCQYLVTGDKQDFGHLYDRSIDGVTIITLTRLAKIVVQARRNVERL